MVGVTGSIPVAPTTKSPVKSAQNEHRIKRDAASARLNKPRTVPKCACGLGTAWAESSPKVLPRYVTLLNDDQRTIALRALSSAAALVDMLPAHCTPPLFHSDVTDLLATIARKDDDVGRLVAAARRHLTRLGFKPAAPPKEQS
jgi:hypothetical protein